MVIAVMIAAMSAAMTTAMSAVMTVVKIASLVKAAVADVRLQEGGVGMGVDAVRLLPGLMLFAKSVTKKDMPPKIVGGDSKMMMMTLITRKPMLLHTGLIQTGTPTRVRRTTSPKNSTT
jgi:hypothetical protein